MRSILVDVTRCKGCNTCVGACARANDLVEDPTLAPFTRGRLSGDRFTTLVRLQKGRTAKLQCMHCVEPSCAAACLVGALHKSPEGPVLYDADKCIGCRYCMLACPFSIPQYQWNTDRPFVRKCQMCYGRPGGPACVQACPHDALQYGERKDLLRVAKGRIRANPKKYIHRVWGEKGGGGTSVLYLSDVPLDKIWPARLGDESVPERTMPIVRLTPFLFVGVASTLSALAFVVHRRNRLAAEKAGESIEEGDGRDPA